jgi:hypothetical protein
MKQSLKIIILILVFVLPIGIFVFLKLFGRNEFGVAPLYVTEAPPHMPGCDLITKIPYVVPDSVRQFYGSAADSLIVIFFGPLSGEGQNQLDRVTELTTSDPVRIVEPGISDLTAAPRSGTSADQISASDARSASAEPPIDGASPVNAARTPGNAATGSPMDMESLRRCIFFLDSARDVVMIDRKGAIRGQYTAADRDEMDRMLTEITIILKKY